MMINYIPMLDPDAPQLHSACIWNEPSRISCGPEKSNNAYLKLFIIHALILIHFKICTDIEQ